MRFLLVNEYRKVLVAKEASFGAYTTEVRFKGPDVTHAGMLLSHDCDGSIIFNNITKYRRNVIFLAWKGPGPCERSSVLRE